MQHRGGNFKAKITGLSEKTDRHKIVLQLLAVFVLAYRAAHKYRHPDVFSFVTGCKMHVAWLFLYLSLWTGEQSKLFCVVDIFKISGVQRQQRKVTTTRVVVTRKKRLRLFYQLMQIRICMYAAFLSMLTWTCKFLLRTFCIIFEINELLKKGNLFNKAIIKQIHLHAYILTYLLTYLLNSSI